MTAGAEIPEEVARDVARVLGAPGSPDPPVDVAALGGGCIHPAARIRSDRGASAFLKWSPLAGTTGFAVEARGLEALSKRGGVRVPEVLGVEEGGPGRTGWLLLEFVEQGPPVPETSRLLGEGLAHLHRPDPEASPGWEEDGWIATLPQPNPPIPRWPEFWTEARLLPRWRKVSDAFSSSAREGWSRMADRMDAVLEGWEEDGICLLHGDLWSGNVITDREGRPVLIDPAVYRGHREADLAMMELFGGFAEETLERYRKARPLGAGYEERRRDAYQLYPLLVHVELFGAGYLPGAEARIRRLSAY